MSDWNTEQYLLFKDERSRPIYDLLHRIPMKNPRLILDIGCGPGTSTIPLKKQYPDAEIIGIDSSPNMIKKARQACNEITWLLKDAREDIADLGQFDIVFSNAVLHWLPDHSTLLPRLFDSLSAQGIFAAQIPYFFGTPIYEPLNALVESIKWDQYIPAKQPANYYDVGYYYEILSQCFTVFDIWTTKHTHVLNSTNDILNWYKSTGFKPFLEQLPTEELRNDFLADISLIIDDLYAPQGDGKYLLRFERLFLFAQNI